MATQTVPVPSASDLTIIEFYEQVLQSYQFENVAIWIVGADPSVTLASDEAAELKRLNGRSIRQVSSGKLQSGITYRRNANPERLATPDTVEFANNGNNFSTTDAIKISNLISNKFSEAATNNPQLLANPEAFAAVIASHQAIITRLEESRIQFEAVRVGRGSCQLGGRDFHGMAIFLARCNPFAAP